MRTFRHHALLCALLLLAAGAAAWPVNLTVVHFNDWWVRRTGYTGQHVGALCAAGYAHLNGDGAWRPGHSRSTVVTAGAVGRHVVGHSRPYGCYA